MKLNGIGLYTWFGYALPFEEKLDMIRQAGFDSIITWFGPEFDQLDGDYSKHAEIAQKHGLSLCNAHIPYYRTDEYWEDKLEGGDLLEKNLTDIRDAASFGVGCLVFHPFGRKYPKEGGDFRVFMDRIMRLGDQADKYEVRLAIENLDDNALLEQILNKAGHQFVGLCFDSGHNHLQCPEDYRIVENFAGRLFALHMHDNHGAADEHLMPYGGNINWKAMVEKIEASAYNGPFTLEAAHPLTMDESGEYSMPVDIGPEEFLGEMYAASLKALEAK